MSLTIDLDTDHTRLRATLPSGHTVAISATEGGLAQLMRLLRAQKYAEIVEKPDSLSGLERLRHFSRIGVGTEVSPTQQEIDHNLHHKTHHEKCPFCRVALSRGQLALEDLL